MKKNNCTYHHSQHTVPPNRTTHVTYFMVFFVLYIQKTTGLILSVLKTTITNATDAAIRHQKIFHILYLIFQTKPILSSDQNPIEVASLVSHNDIHLYLSSIKTFSFFVNRPLCISVYEDGSFTAIDYYLLRLCIKNIRIIRKSYCDMQVTSHIHNKDIISFRKRIPHLRKIIDIPLLSNKEKIILMDSDILFFSPPVDIIRWIDSKEKKYFYLKDFQNAYIFSSVEIKALLHQPIIPKINVGLVGCHKELFQLNRYAAYFKAAKQLSPVRFDPWNEQTLFALLLSSIPASRRKHLPASYSVSQTKTVSSSVVCRHYITPIRDKFYNDAIRVLSQIL